jgi:hypothetical protein
MFHAFSVDCQIVAINRENIRIRYKSTQLVSILCATLDGKMNLARIKLILS